jgi:hypothetical protein
MNGLWPGLIGRLPKAVFVTPMVLHWLWLALRHRSVSLPSAANPAIALGGLVGESKMIYFDQVRPAEARWLARVGAVAAGDGARGRARAVLTRLALDFPVVAKPDIGWCGFGVRRLDDQAALDAYLDAYPEGETLLLQEYIDLPGEAGLFYLRWPGEERGRLRSLTVRTAVPGATVWSHRMGGRYHDRSDALTPQLEDAVDAIARGMPDFHVGRFDVRYATLDALGRGEFKVLEINGAGSEAIEFFGEDVPFFASYRGVLGKNAMLFALGAQNRARGARPCGWWALQKAFRRQHRLLGMYPESN